MINTFWFVRVRTRIPVRAGHHADCWYRCWYRANQLLVSQNIQGTHFAYRRRMPDRETRPIDCEALGRWRTTIMGAAKRFAFMAPSLSFWTKAEATRFGCLPDC